MKTIILTAVLTVAAVASIEAAELKTIYKVFKLSPNELAVSCLNGADPTTYPKLLGSDALIISCGDQNSK